MKIPTLRQLHKRGAIIAGVAMLALFLFAGGALCATGEGQEGDHGTHWVATDTYRVMNFLVLAVGLFFLARKPVSQGLKGRIKGIQDHLADLEAKKMEAEAQLAQYNQKLTLLDQEAEKIVEGYIQQGKDAKARILEEAQAAAVRLEEQARRNIDHEFLQAKNKLKSEIVEKALAAAEEMVKGQITAEDQEKLVDEYLDKVVA
ncbi:MAG TPA: ATP synthase F0 subunit B [Desulfobacterales bacterium]|nr:ATP synthase F0 subunit B [Desulfobacterales bacterium]